jgi:hypothetical protein
MDTYITHSPAHTTHAGQYTTHSTEHSTAHGIAHGTAHRTAHGTAVKPLTDADIRRAQFMDSKMGAATGDDSDDEDRSPVRTDGVGANGGPIVGQWQRSAARATQTHRYTDTHALYHPFPLGSPSLPEHPARAVEGD